MKKINSVNFEFENYLNAEKIYVPIKNCIKSINDKVDKYEILNPNGKPIFSPVSGVITNKNANYIEITNDFKENVKRKLISKKNIYDVTSDEAIKLIEKYSYVDIVSDYKYLIVSLIDKDKYEVLSKYLINNFITKILDTVDCISQKLGIDYTYLIMKNNDDEIINLINNNIGTYPNIKVKMLNDAYALGFPEVLVPKVLNKNVSLHECLCLDLNEVLSIYNSIRNEKPSIERLISVTHKGITKIINVKIGTRIGDIKNLFELNGENTVINGLMSGYETYDDNIITNDVNSIFFVYPDGIISKKCINCGMCQKMCPVGLNPKYIRTHNNADTSKCIHCGVCTYICPSKINFKPYLGVKHE